MSGKLEWPFSETENTAVITTLRVVRQESPVLCVVHDENGDWQFLDGNDIRTEDAVVVSLGSIVKRDNSLASIAGLGSGCQAWRENIGYSWKQSKLI